MRRDPTLVGINSAEIIIPTALAGVVGLQVPGAWREANGPPYTRLRDGAPIEAPTGYRRFTGAVAVLPGDEKDLVIVIAHPERGSGFIELRYRGQSDVCPLAGTIRVAVGTGPAVPPPALPFPEDPLLELIPLC